MYNTKTDYERHLEDEIERLKQDQRQQQEEQERHRKERQREWNEEREIELRSATTWPEALRKQITLFRNELSATMWGRPLYGPKAGPDMPEDDFFGPGAEACERALVIWEEVEAAQQEQIKALEAQIRAIKAFVKLEVSEKLLAEGEGKPPGWRSVAWAIRDEDDLGRWLDW